MLQEMKYPYDPVNHAGYGVSGYGDYSHPYPPQVGAFYGKIIF